MRLTLILAGLVIGSVSIASEGAAGLQWTAPGGWKALGSQPMRAATYAVPAAPGDTTAAECAVYFFGAGQGGSVEANVDRWKSQFKDAAGKPAAAKVTKRAIHGLETTTIDTSGVYSGLGGPVAPGKPVAGYRLLGAIVEGPGGNIFVKFTGPMKTIAANEQKFTQLLESFRRVS